MTQIKPLNPDRQISIGR